MTFDVLQKRYNYFYQPTYRVFVNNIDLYELQIEVFNVSVNNTLNAASDFSFTVNNPFTPNREDFEYIQRGYFKEGSPVEIKMGYIDTKHISTIFCGYITAVEITFAANGISQITVKGFDNLHKMMKKQQPRTWGSRDQPVKYSDIVRELASEYSLGTSNIKNTGEQFPQVKKQNGESDFDFIVKKLAERIGFEVFVFRKDLYFRPPASNSRDASTDLEWGKSLITFTPETNTGQQVSEVEVRGWDADNQVAIVGTARSGDEDGRDGGDASGSDLIQSTQGAVKKSFWRPVSSQRDADDQAKAILKRVSEGLVKGRGESIGLPEILPGKNIILTGLGKKYSKMYYVERTSHSVGSSGYKTNFNIKESTI